MALEVSVVDEQDDVAVETGVLAELARAVLVSEGIEGPAELSLSFVDEARMAELNERYRGHSGPTDVLSFGMDEPSEPYGGGAPVMLGDVVICPEVAARNAPYHGHSVREELSLLVVHGVLHLLGMDHEEPAEAEAMEARETRHLSEFRGAP